MRYLGVLAGHSSLRAEAVPKKPAAPPKQLPLFDDADEPTTSAKSATKKTAETSRHPWSWLLQRVFAVDILKCEKCGGRLRIVEVAKKPDDHVLGVLGSLRSLCARSPRGGSRAQRARLRKSAAESAARRRAASVRARAAAARVR